MLRGVVGKTAINWMAISQMRYLWIRDVDVETYHRQDTARRFISSDIECRVVPQKSTPISLSQEFRNVDKGLNLCSTFSTWIPKQPSNLEKHLDRGRQRNQVDGDSRCQSYPRGGAWIEAGDRRATGDGREELCGGTGRFVCDRSNLKANVPVRKD